MVACEEKGPPTALVLLIQSSESHNLIRQIAIKSNRNCRQDRELEGKFRRSYETKGTKRLYSNRYQSLYYMAFPRPLIQYALSSDA